MLKQEAIQAMEAFTSLAKAEFDHFVDNAADQEYIDAAQLILDAQAKGGRVHITGIGKPGHVSGYGASLMSSTGTPTYFLHGTEAVHGSCGQLAAGDVVICISNSGETAEGGPLNRAPRASILAETFVLQRLSVLLQVNRGLDPKEYVKWHPGGTLGQLRENEK